MLLLFVCKAGVRFVITQILLYRQSIKTNISVRLVKVEIPLQQVPIIKIRK